MATKRPRPKDRGRASGLVGKCAGRQCPGDMLRLVLIIKHCKWIAIMSMGPPGVEYWPKQVADEEGKSFEKRFGSLTGLTTSELIDRFGEPTCKRSGFSIRDDGTRVDQDDTWSYLQTLPRTAVEIAVSHSNQTLQRIEFSPKIIRCPANLVNCYGVMYAPNEPD